MLVPLGVSERLESLSTGATTGSKSTGAATGSTGAALSSIAAVPGSTGAALGFTGVAPDFTGANPGSTEAWSGSCIFQDPSYQQFYLSLYQYNVGQRMYKWGGAKGGGGYHELFEVPDLNLDNSIPTGTPMDTAGKSEMLDLVDLVRMKLVCCKSGSLGKGWAVPKLLQKSNGSKINILR